ncbi:Ig-like domain-containing protein [Rubricoccus marinus]|uniref:Tandem-95 repeat protein n=1 Tax=Rubricoccus marinus TaxID=716817 RepID=A0A259U278_9BACT|nr:Ig-like domain-containing protein [Rubricoccus marinus]OZC04071.1 hypothetical protein BSZ36_14405 [Rubricoccus marinus]
MLRFLVSSLFFVLLAGAPLAQTVTWTGGGDGTSWSDGANWSTGTTPGPSADAVVDLRDAATVVDEPLTIGSLSLTAINASIALSAPLAVSGDVRFDHANARITGPEDLTIDGRLRWKSGTFQSDAAAPATVLARGGATFTGASASSGNVKNLDGSRLVLASGTESDFAAWYFYGLNGGTLEVQEGATLEFSESGTVNVFRVGAGSTLAPQLVVDGTLTRSAAGSPLEIQWGARVAGEVAVTAPEAKLVFEGAFEDQNATYRAGAGTLVLGPSDDVPVVFGEGSQFLVASGATLGLARGDLELRGLLDNGGTLALGTDANVGGNGVAVTLPASLSVERLGGDALRIGQRATVTLARTAPLSVASLYIDFQGVLNLNGPLAVSGDLTLWDQSSRLSAPEAVTVGGRLTWRGGRIEGGGTVEANGGVSFIGEGASASYTKALDGTKLVLPGGTSNTYEAWYFFGANGAELEIQEGATLDLSVGQMYRGFWVEAGSTAPPVLDVDGTLVRSASSFPSFRLDWDSEISGTLQLETADEEIQIRGALTDEGGTYRVTAGSLVFGTPDGTSVLLTPSSQILVSPGATLGVARGDVTASGAFDVGGTLAIKDASGLGGAGGSLTLREGIGLERLAGDGLIVGGNRGTLILEPGLASTVPSLAIGFGGTLDLRSDLTVTGAFEHANSSARVQGPRTLTVRGLTTWTGGVHAGEGETRFEGGLTALQNGGSASWYKRIEGRTLTVASGETAAWPGSARTTVSDGGRLVIEPGAALDLSADGPDWRTEGTGGTLDLQGDLVFTGDFSWSMAWDVENTGTASVLGAGTRITGTWDNTPDGRLQGEGQIDLDNGTGALVNRGVVAPEDSDGGTAILPVRGNWAAGPGTLDIGIGGTEPGTGHDQLTVTRTATLSGTLRVRLADGYAPEAGAEYAIVTANALAGSFDETDLPAGFEVVYEPTRVLLRASGAGGPGLADSPWPMQGGDLAHTNQAPVEGPTGLALDWEYDAGVSFALVNQPVLGEDGTLYTSDIGDFLFAVNPDGTERWRAETGGVRNSAAVAEDGTIYSGSSDGGLYAINPDGSQKWRFNAGDRVNTSPAIAPDGTVYIASNAQKLFAVNPDGTLKWERNLGGFALSSPAVAEDGTVVTGSSAGNVVAFAADGSFRWNAAFEGVTRSPTLTPDGRVLVGLDERFVALGLETGSQIWERVGVTQGETPGYLAGATPLTFAQSGNSLVALSVASGETVWEVDLGENTFPSAVTLDALGKAYVLRRFPGETGALLVLDAASGAVLSTTPIDARLERAPILDDQGRVIVPTYDGLLAFTAAGGPVLSVSPEALGFGEVAAGTTETRTLQLSNTGGSPLTVFDVYEGGAQPAFAAAFDDAVLIAPGASVDVAITFTPPEAGAFEGQIFVESDSEESSFVTVQVTGTGIESATPPLARDDEATTPEDTPVTVQVLNNDTSTVSEPLAITATTAPANGALALTNGGTRIRYTPEADFFGTDNFTYTITDSGGSDTATVTVTVSPVNDAPVAQDDEATTNQDTPVTIAVLANDADVDSGTLSVAETTTPDNGSVEIIAGGSAVRYTPVAGFSGTDSFAYTVSDGEGGTDTATVTVTVTAVVLPPIARNDAAATPEDTAVRISVLANDESRVSEPLAITATTAPGNGAVEVDGAAILYTPASNFFGTDSFTYTITDSGGSDTATVTVTVAPVNDAPLATDDEAATDEDTPVTVQVLANDSDIDSETLTVASVTQPASGAAVIVSGGTRVRYTPEADFFGTDAFTYTVADGAGGTDTATVTVTVAPVNDAPVAQNDAVATQEDTAVRVDVLANDADADGDALNVASVTAPASGAAVIIEGGAAVRYTPALDFVGTDSFTYTVADGNGGTDTATVTVQVGGTNDAPVAADDAASTPEDQAVEIAVLANDSDPDGDALTVSALGTPASGSVTTNGTTVTYTPAPDFNGTDLFTYTITDGVLTASAAVTVTVTPVNDAPLAEADAATTAEDAAITIAVLANDADADGDALAVSSLTQPSNGTATTDGATVVYTPEADFFGTDTFAYTASDGNGGTDTATVTVTVTPVNDAPLAQDDAASTSPNEAVEIAVLANDSDVDGDALTVTEATGAANGTLATNGETVTYTPAPGFRGTDSFAYTVSDGALTATATVTVTVGGNAPPLAADDDATTPEDQAVTVAVLANDSDPDGDALTVSSVTQPASGAAETDGVTVTYTPAPDFNGTDRFTYTLADGAGGSATATVTITVTPVNDAPLASDDSAVTPEATAVEIAVLANDSDPDGDALSVASVTPPASGGTATTDGTTVTFTPASGFNGTVAFTYTVTDGDLTDTAEVTVTVSGANLPPIARDDAAPVRPGDSVLIDVLANDEDPEGGALTIASVGTPASGGTAAPEAGQIRYTAPSGFSDTDTFTYTVSDPQGATATATVTITAQAYRFALTDLGTLGGARSAAMAVAADGRVVGTAEDAGGALRPTLWRTGTGAATPEALGLPGAPSGFATAIDGQTVVGVQYGAGGEAEAFRTGTGTLPGLGGTLTNAYGVREGGATVGSSAPASGGIEALAWDEAGAATPLGTFGLARSEAFGVSPLGLVVGYAQSDVDARAFAGADLLSGADGRAYAANVSGVVVGSIGNGTGDVSAVRWTGGGAPEVLDGLGGGFAEAYAINSAGWVVGASGAEAGPAAKSGGAPARGPLPLGGRLAPEAQTLGGGAPAETSSIKRSARGAEVQKAGASGAIETRAVLWVDGQTLDLGTIIDVPGWTLLEARGINDAGQIAGTGLFNGQPRAFLLTPTDNAAPLAVADRAETAMGQSVEIALVANDRDDDGDALTVAALLAPEHGSVQAAGPLAARYTPAPGFTGEDTFGYTLADGRGGLAQAEVRVLVRAEAPEPFALRTPAPNPASGDIAFAFTLDAPQDDVRLDVTDLLGRSLAVATEGARDAGEHTVRFDVRGLAPGTYVCRLLVGGQALMRTFTVVR